MVEPDRDDPNDRSEGDGPYPTDDRTLGVGMAVGLVIGTAIGVATEELALWLPLGVAFGAGIGYWLDQG